MYKPEYGRGSWRGIVLVLFIDSNMGKQWEWLYYQDLDTKLIDYKNNKKVFKLIHFDDKVGTKKEFGFRLTNWKSNGYKLYDSLSNERTQQFINFVESSIKSRRKNIKSNTRRRTVDRLEKEINVLNKYLNDE